MAHCAQCGAVVLFQGVRDQDHVFCNEGCRARGAVLTRDMIAKEVRDIHGGDCPHCGGPGPVDVHEAHTVWSAIVLTSWNSTPHVCCASCGDKVRRKALLSSLCLGWWGFPFGLLITPIQVVRNLRGPASTRDPLQPSKELNELVEKVLAAQLSAAANPVPRPSLFDKRPDA